MLMGHGDFVLPAEIPANEFLTIEGEKLSTSRNWAIWLDDYLDIFPPDPLRYCLAANAPETKDADFSWKEFQTRNNSELADILGNFVNRALTFIQKYRDNRVPEMTDPDDMDRQVIEAIHRTTSSMTEAFESFETRRAVRDLMDLARIGNKYFADKQPWALRKTDPPKCDTALAVCMKLISSLCLLMEPILPHSSRELKRMIGWDSGLEGVHWADIPHLQIPAGHLLGNPSILFAKIEDQTIQAQIDKLQQMKR
jgi:methionyl-tRNA synthetase